MLTINTLSVALAAGAGQGLVLAALLWLAPRNVEANRALAALIVAVALYMTPYIIGYAGAYDLWPWLSFSPFSLTLAFGPLFYWHTSALTGATLGKRPVVHFIPVAVQFLAQAVVFPLPLETKNWWDTIAHSPWIDPILSGATFVSLAVYGWLSLRRYLAYKAWLRHNRADGSEFDPAWIRNALIALAILSAVWLGFRLANMADPTRDYFDQFWLYVAFGFLAIYLGVEGWRNANLHYPTPDRPPAPASVAESAPSWSTQGAAWAAEVDRQGLWRDPEISLASLARALGTNTTYLSKALNEGLGVSFHDFVNRRRVDAMKQLLADPAESRDLMAIAFDAGFRSKASFNRVFAEFVGMTPSAFRRASRLKA